MLVAACAGVPRVEVPVALQPHPSEALSMVAAARGVQIYECRERKGVAAEPEWVFVAPEAELFDKHGRSIGRHGAGPHWQAGDGSRIQGTVKARAEAPVAGAIPWLLLTAKSAGTEGSFSQVTSIQRVNTVGGSAPAIGCSRSTAGMSIRVPYTADYYFYSVR
jgi:Protein of unknown function (DUF3455)